MSKKQFRLLKDAPDVDADAIFTFNFSGNWCHYVTVGKSGKDVEYDQSYVENAKDWFEEVLPVSEPVKERIEISSFNTLSRFTPVGKVIQVLEVVTDKKITGDRFPAIKQAIESCLNELLPQPPSEVDAIRADTWYAARKITDKVVGEIDFKDGDRCPFYEKYFNSINDYLSSLNLNSNDTGKEDNETKSANWRSENLSKQSAPEPSALPNKEWDITAFKAETNQPHGWLLTKNPDGTFGHYEAIEQDLLSSSIHSIHSVRRLSDNTVFSVGDSYDGGYKITAFKITGTTMMYECNDNECFYNIAGLRIPDSQKPPITDLPKQQVVEDKPVLFTTEDNQPVYMGETYWKVTILDQCWKANETVMREELANPPSYFKYFSTKEAAEQFCLKNKPSLSLNDVTNFLHKHFMFDTEYYEALKEIAKQKLSHQK